MICVGVAITVIDSVKDVLTHKDLIYAQHHIFDTKDIDSRSLCVHQYS